jgi:hypothetical protein
MRIIAAASLMFALALASAVGQVAPGPAPDRDNQRVEVDNRTIDGDRNEQDKRPAGQAIFRFDTFGDEQLWTGVLRMHEVIAKVPPATALAVGLKVDVEALPPAVKAALRAGKVDLTNPAVEAASIDRSPTAASACFAMRRAAPPVTGDRSSRMC